MIESQRKFNYCVLCGSDRKLTAEHLFGRGVAKRVGDSRMWHAHYQAPDGTFKEAKGGNPFLSTTYPCLCEECNTRRFSQMMELATPLIVALAQGHQSVLLPEDQAVLLRYFERLGFLIDVVASNYHMTPEDRTSKHLVKNAEWRRLGPAFTLDQRKAWLLETSRLDVPQVYLGRHVGTLGLDLECSIDHSMRIEAGMVTPARRFHCVIGQLAIEIQIPTVASEPYEPGDCYHQLQPSDAAVTWPPRRDVGYEDFWGLHQQTQRVVEAMHTYSDPIRRAAAEYESRLAAAVAAARNPTGPS